jgi:hypothetical protein
MPRTKGARSKRTIAREQARDILVKGVEGKTAYEYLREIMNHPDTPEQKRMEAAALCLPYEMPKLAATMVQAQVATTAAPAKPRPPREDPREVFATALLGDSEEVRAAAVGECGMENMLAIWKRRTDAVTRDRDRATAKAEAEAASAAQPAIIEVDQPKPPKPQGKVEEATLLPVPVPIPVRKFTPSPQPMPEARGCGRSVVEGHGNPFSIFGGGSGPQVGDRTATGGVITEINRNMKFR